MAITDHSHSTSEKLKQAADIANMGVPAIRQTYTEGYRDAVFAIWYSAGKPTVRKLKGMLPDPAEFGISSGFPGDNTMVGWVQDFQERAVSLDEQVSRQMQERLISEKVQMLNAHADIGHEMQQMALDYLREHPEKLNPNAAVRLLVEGVNIERESRGIGKSVMQMIDRSDEDLLKQINELLAFSPAELEVITDEEDAV